MASDLPDQGRSFVIPPPSRLFAVFDAEADGVAALADLYVRRLARREDAWVYVGETGAALLDPRRVSIGARLLQLLLSADVEYRAGMAETVGGGGMVVAVATAREATHDLVPVLRAHGGHSFAYRRAINFVPVA